MSSDSLYPCKTSLDGNFSIFMTAMKHDVNLKKNKKFNEWYQSFTDLGWDIHPYFDPELAKSDSTTKKKRAFDPRQIFTPATHDSMFGKSGNLNKGQDKKSWIPDRLDPRKNDSHSVDSLLLSRKATDQYINQELQLLCDKNNGQPIFSFKIEWADFWFFNDGTRILAFKTHLIKTTKNGCEYTPSIGDLNVFNRTIRFLSSGDFGWKIRVENSSDCLLWADLILKHWLGELHPADLFDRNSKYFKVLTTAQIPNITSNQEEFLWNAPSMDPPVDFAKHYAAYERGEWNEAMSAYQRASLLGFPSVSEFLLYELAATTDEGAAGGLNGTRGWQMSPAYLSKLLDEQGIEIWEYSRGLALHDSVAFLAYDESMPTILNTERWYYPLYVYFYHLQFRLNCFAEEIVDPALSGLIESRRLKNEFMTFRNQFWFCSVTVDFQGEIISDRLKKAMRVDSLYETVQSEVNEISEFINEKIERGKNALLAALVIAFYPISYLWEISGISDLLHNYAKSHYMLTVASTIGFILILILGSAWLVPKLARWGQHILSRVSKLLSS